MRKSRRPIRIASRQSRLARAQAEAVGRALGRLHPGVRVEFLWIESEGDRSSASLKPPPSGLKGMFTRTVEDALLQDRADLAVHSLKDLPTRSSTGLTLAATPRRGDPRDCLVTAEGLSLDALPQGATLGTSSPRRTAQIRRLRPDLVIMPLRGNVDTRLRKVTEQGLLDATILAVAGLQRLGLKQYAHQPIDPQLAPPSASQGALGLQCRTDDHVTVSRCLPLNDPATAAAVHLERAIVDGLQGDCHAAMAVYAAPVSQDGRRFAVHAQVYSHDGSRLAEARGEGLGKELDRLAQRMLTMLMEQGAEELLRPASDAADQPNAGQNAEPPSAPASRPMRIEEKSPGAGALPPVVGPGSGAGIAGSVASARPRGLTSSRPT